MRIIILILLFPLLGFSQNGINTPVKAFFGAYGGGSNASGGRGKALAIITSLNRNTALTYHAASGADDEWYEGGLFPALQNSNVGYIVFNISGNIVMGQSGSASGTGLDFGFEGMPDVNNKTIFGQSAPQGGITITGGTFRFNGREGDNQNLIFRYFRSRPVTDQDGVLTDADDAYTWAFLFDCGNNIVVDHCSGSFAQDKVMGAFIQNTGAGNGRSLTNITFSHNIVSEGNTCGYVEINPGQSNQPEDLVDEISWIGNTFTGCNRTPNFAFDGDGELLNNIAHHTPSWNTLTYHGIRFNHIGNYYSKPDPGVVDTTHSNDGGDPLIYSTGNYYEGVLTGVGVEDNKDMWRESGGSPPAGSAYFTGTKHPDFDNPWTPITAAETFTLLITDGDVGAYQYLDDDGFVQTYRDTYDTSIISAINTNSNYVRNVSNFVLPTIPSNTRPGTYDTDNDGMADDWEIREFGGLSQSYRGDFDGDGYENIEEYMNQVDGITGPPGDSHIILKRNSRVAIGVGIGKVIIGQ